ncbi:uncharacterized protein EAF01_002936 [Botrytis porri]|uniref:uncharacterized protein n=1 Tax=Botrytis porri TaxID=87229 RepID=UPI001900B686|nr:uncharacterized protein EAF01_002936 [Botrytis porri]KAF7911429.1 hypothetical protein EAF01_002936 [Botrytis porri]
MSDQSNRQGRENLQEYDRWLVEEIVPYVIRDVPEEVDAMQAYSPSNELYQSNSPLMISTIPETPPGDVWTGGNDYWTEVGYSLSGQFVPSDQYIPFDSDLAQASPFTGYLTQSPSVAEHQVQTPSVAGYQAQIPPTFNAEPSGHIGQGHGMAYAQSRPNSPEFEDGWRQSLSGVWEWLGQGAPPGFQETQPQPPRDTRVSEDGQNLNQEAYARASAPSSQRYSSPSVQLVTTPSQFLAAIDHSPRSWENMTNASDSQSEDQNRSVAGDGQRVSGNHRGDQENARRARRRRRQ